MLYSEKAIHRGSNFSGKGAQNFFGDLSDREEVGKWHWCVDVAKIIQSMK